MMYFPNVDAYNLNFEAEGYETIYFTLLIGTIFFIFLGYVAMVLIVGLLKVVGHAHEHIHRVEVKISEKLFWGSFLRLMMESYLEITLAIGINVAIFHKSVGVYAFPGVILSNVIAIIFAVASFALPFFFLIFYTKKTGRWNELVFVKKWGTVIEGMDTNPHPEKKGYDKRWALFFPLIMLGRRLLFVITVITMNNFVWMQIALQFACTTATMIYLL